jgi:hypothetical protein
MAEAMERAELNDRELAEKVEATQPMIWNIRKDPKTKTSTLVMPISRVLGIAPPEFRDLLDDEQLEWSRLGHILAHADPGGFLGFITFMRAQVARLDPDERIARSIGQAAVVAPTPAKDSDRKSDESPVDPPRPKKK